MKIAKNWVRYAAVAESIMRPKTGITHYAAAIQTTACWVEVGSTAITTVNSSIRVEGVLLTVGYQWGVVNLYTLVGWDKIGWGVTLLARS
jgi:hypothetical protein